MKLPVRRVGNSLGVLLPKSLLSDWGVTEGDALELTARGIGPAKAVGQGGYHLRLDELKRLLSLAVVRDFTAQQIRAQGLANLYRWKSRGTWVSAFDEWTEILRSGDDGELFNAMLGRNEKSNELRQSMPYVGLLSEAEVKKVYEEAGA
jgi:hypothetical protein